MQPEKPRGGCQPSLFGKTKLWTCWNRLLLIKLQNLKKFLHYHCFCDTRIVFSKIGCQITWVWQMWQQIHVMQHEIKTVKSIYFFNGHDLNFFTKCRLVSNHNEWIFISSFSGYTFFETKVQQSFKSTGKKKLYEQ